MFGCQSAVAESNEVQRTDPKANSPAGVIYQIPLDSGRRDAAPVLPVGSRPGGGGGGDSGSSGASGSTIGGDSSSGGGSGSTAAGGGSSGASGAPGGATDESKSATAVASADGGKPNDGTPNDPSSIHSENGFGSSSQVPGLSRAALVTGAGVAEAHTPGSTLPTYLLLGLVVVAAAAAGLFAGTGRRRFRRR
jgi:hypothetical protein